MENTNDTSGDSNILLSCLESDLLYKEGICQSASRAAGQADGGSRHLRPVGPEATHERRAITINSFVEPYPSHDVVCTDMRIMTPRDKSSHSVSGVGMYVRGDIESINTLNDRAAISTAGAQRGALLLQHVRDRQHLDDEISILKDPDISLSTQQTSGRTSAATVELQKHSSSQLSATSVHRPSVDIDQNQRRVSGEFVNWTDATHDDIEDIVESLLDHRTRSRHTSRASSVIDETEKRSQVGDTEYTASEWAPAVTTGATVCPPALTAKPCLSSDIQFSGDLTTSTERVEVEVHPAVSCNSVIYVPRTHAVVNSTTSTTAPLALVSRSRDVYCPVPRLSLVTSNSECVGNKENITPLMTNSHVGTIDEQIQPMLEVVTVSEDRPGIQLCGHKQFGSRARDQSTRHMRSRRISADQRKGSRSGGKENRPIGKKKESDDDGKDKYKEHLAHKYRQGGEDGSPSDDSSSSEDDVGRTNRSKGSRGRYSRKSRDSVRSRRNRHRSHSSSSRSTTNNRSQRQGCRGRREGNGSPNSSSGSRSRDHGRRRNNWGKNSGNRQSGSDDSQSSRRRRSRGRSKHQWIKPEKFSGETSFESFMVTFDNAARFNRWGEREKLAWLQASVTGPAAQLLWGSGDITYKQLVNKLRDRYGAKGMEARYQTELRCRRRRNGESIRELAQDIRRLMSLAYPGKEDSDLGEHIARDSFLAALNDAEMETKIREREPRTFEKTVKLALRIEVTSAAVSSSGGRRNFTRRVISDYQHSDALQSKTETVGFEYPVSGNAVTTGQSQFADKRGCQQSTGSRGRGPPKERVRRSRATVKEEDPQLEQLTKKIHEMELANRKKEHEMSTRLDVMNKELERYKHLDQLRTHNAIQRQPSQRPTSQPLSQRGTRSGNSDGSRSPGCWNCGEPGHFARECSQNHGGQIPSRSGQQDQQQSFRISGTKECHIGAAGSATYLRARVNGEEQDCLLDSGSEVSILPATLVSSNQLSPTTYILKAANNTGIPVLGQATVSFDTSSYMTTITGLVSEHVSEVMLGVDWLTRNKVKWNFDEAGVELGGHYHRLCSRPKGQPWCRRVILQDSAEVPARSQVNLPCRVVFHGRQIEKQGQHWGTEPTMLGLGLHVGRTLTPTDKFSDIPIRVMNVNNEPKQMTAGTVVANLEPLVVLTTDAKASQYGSSMATVRATTHTDSESVQEEEVPDFIRELVDKVDDALPESTVVELQKLLMQNESVFSTSEYDLGLTDLVVHHIDTGAARPVRQQLRKFPPAHIETITTHVDNMLRQGIIEPASSPWASNVVLVKKKDGTYRCCIDYRQLNNVTVRDAYPLPRTDACLDAMADASWFSTFDLRSSYHQVWVSPEDRDKTTFICPRGMYRFRTMPFGLCNAGATFQRLMDILMTGLHLEICLVYLDDIVVFARDAQQHLERLKQVFDRLRGAGLKLKPSKCAFFRRSVVFLGHVISKEGIETDPAKVRAITEWPTPTSITEVRSFVGLASYYRRFVRSFAQIAAPLHALMQKNCRFQWSHEAQQSFDALKTALTTPPILAMPNDVGLFTLDTDASDHSIGAVLSQEQHGVERVIAYASRSLDRREQNYCVTRKELLAVVHFLRYFKQYLLGRKFRIRTDHAALTWLKRTPDPIGQQARWLELMEEFDFSIEHRPGIRHGNADALSRHPCPKKACLCQEVQSPLFGGPADRTTIARPCGRSELLKSNLDPIVEEEETEAKKSMIAGVRAQFAREPSEVENADYRGTDSVVSSALSNSHYPDETWDIDIPPWSLEGIRIAQRTDPDIKPIIELLETSSETPDWDDIAPRSKDTKILWSFWSRLAVHDGILKRRFESADGKKESWQVIIPKTLREEFLKTIHGGMSGGHLGLKKTSAAIQQRAYWPTWSSDLARFLQRCTTCVRYHRGSLPRHAEMQTPLVGEPWEKVSIDITGPHPKSSKQNAYILTCVDHFTKWAEALPIPNHTATTVARTLVVHVFSRFGTPVQLLSDRGPEFESELFTQLMRWLEIDKLRTSSYKPSTNGVVERFHRTLNSMLGKVVSESQRDWDERLPSVMAAYRASPHSSTGYSPNKLFLGRENRMPIDVVMGLPLEEVNGDQSIDEYVVHQQELAGEAYQLVRQHLQQNAERRKVAYDARVKKREYTVGDWVWYFYPRRFTRKSPKWQRCYIGPYLIVRAIPPVNYVLQKSQRSQPFVVHADKIKKCFTPPETTWVPTGEDVEKTNVNGYPRTTESEKLPQPTPTLLTTKPVRRKHQSLAETDKVEPQLPSHRAHKAPSYLRDYACSTRSASQL